jgi:hypothetical protein
MLYRLLIFLMLMTFGATVNVFGQRPPDPEMILKAQREAMVPLSFMDGEWRGTGWAFGPTDERYQFTQTERVGPFLGGSVKVIEGKAYDDQGKVLFNAFGTVYFDPAKKTYTMHSYAQGNVGDFSFKPTADGFEWEILAGPMTIHNKAVIKDGTWHEVGDRIMSGKDPVRIFEMNIKRIADSLWPAGGAVKPK